MKHSRILVNCSCNNEYQDKQYGKRKRIATPINKTRSMGKLQEVRCTSCGSIHRQFQGQ